MTEPEQVYVNAPDCGCGHPKADHLRRMDDCQVEHCPCPVYYLQVPEPEWEPTDDRLDIAEQAVGSWLSRDACRSILQALYREGLL